MIILQLTCLATAIYFEAGNQDYRGKLSVGNVIMNRVEDQRYPGSACEVVKQGEYHEFSTHPVKWRCQFTYWCDGKDEKADDKDVMAHSWRAAVSAYYKVADATGGATHYHSDKVSPFWADISRTTATIGNHIFYKL